MLSDPGSTVIREFGILSTTVPETNREQYGIAFPGAFILHRNGIITSRFFEQASQERDTVASIMARAGRGNSGPATKISASHVEMTTYATDRTVASGTHCSPVVDVRPASRVHVYAPGVIGYKAIGLAMDAQPGLLFGRFSVHGRKTSTSNTSNRSTSTCPCISAHFESCRTSPSTPRRTAFVL